jgi:hypothetical protein
MSVMLHRFARHHIPEDSTVTWQLKGQNNGARRNCPLLGNGSVNTYCGKAYERDSKATVKNGAFYAIRAEIILRKPTDASLRRRRKGTQCLGV